MSESSIDGASADFRLEEPKSGTTKNMEIQAGG